MNIAATIKKKFKVRATDSNHNESQGCGFFMRLLKTVRLARQPDCFQEPIFPNSLDRDFTVEKPGEKIVTDITCVATRQGFLSVTLVSVNGKLKMELLYRQEVFETKEAARDAVIEYIEGYYNSKRRHQTLNYQRPNDVWNEYFAKVLTGKKRCVK